MQIKERCWRYDTVKGAYFVKYYEDEIQAQKVRTLHETLAASNFPYSLPITSGDRSPYIVQRWMDGKAADYERQEHRTETLHMLEALHTLTTDWTLPYMSVQNLYEKWQGRLVKFQHHEQMLRPLIGQDYDAIVQQAKFALRHMQYRKPKTYSVLHGDVVHHNFLLGDRSLIIDFDLAHLGDPAEEVILWMHRVLPHIDYDVERLLAEQPYTKIALPKLHYLRYPNELLREWLYVLQVDEAQRSQLCAYVQAFTTEMVQHYPKINTQIERLTQGIS